MKTASYIFYRVFLAGMLVCCFPWSAHAGFRVGVIMSGDIPYYSAMHEAFVAEFNKNKPADDDVELILQRPFPDTISWSNAARKLIAFDVDLIVTYGAPATLAVLNEKSKIPVVYAGVYDPETSLIKGKNFTGCGYKVPLSSLLRYLRRIKKVDALQLVFSGVEEDTVHQSEEVSLLAQQQGMKVKKIDIRTRSDLVQLNTLNANDAVFLTGSSLVHLWLREIMSVVREEKVPSADIFPDATVEGVLMTLYQPADEQGKMAAEMAQRVLRGEKASEVPQQVFRDTELVFNLSEARGINIDFPIQLIIEATRVIK